MFSSSKDVLDHWMRGVNTAAFDSVLALYNDEAVLLPTFSSHTYADKGGITSYFEQLGQRGHISIDLHESTVRSQQHGNKLETISGIYTWHFDVDGEPMSFEARFTFVCDLSAATPVLHHHSSQVPQGLS